MADRQGQPVVIGTGLTGLAISRFLTRAGIGHRLVGDPPGRSLRLGESLDLPGTLILEAAFSDCRRFFHAKDEVALLAARRRMALDVRISRRRNLVRGLRLGGITAPDHLLHVDRVHLDPALYGQTISSPFCKAVRGWAGPAHHEAGGDRITALQVDGRTIEPGYVFDTTSPRGPVATAAGLQPRWLGPPQRTAFTHFLADAPLPACAWTRATTLLRLTTAEDGLDGMAWCIPLGQRVSVGVSVESDEGHITGPALLEAAVGAYARRRIDIRAVAPGQTDVRSFDHRHFVQPRVFGANWVLAGSSACQVWFMSGSGVGLGLTAAWLAPALVRHPRRAGRRYARYLRSVHGSQALLGPIRYGDLGTMSEPAAHALLDPVVHSNLKRGADFLGAIDRRLAGAVGRVGYGLCRSGLLYRRQFQIHTAPQI